MKKIVYAKCPYCGHPNKMLAKLPKQSTKSSARYCSKCNKMFLLQLLITVSTEAYAIEGQRESDD